MLSRGVVSALAIMAAEREAGITDHDSFLRGHGFAIVTEDVANLHYITPQLVIKKLYKKQQVEIYLQKQHSMGRLLEVQPSMFNFTSRKRKLPDCGGDTARKRQVSKVPSATSTVEVMSMEEAMSARGSEEHLSHVDRVVKLLTKNETPCNHKNELDSETG